MLGQEPFKKTVQAETGEKSVPLVLGQKKNGQNLRQQKGGIGPAQKIAALPPPGFEKLKLKDRPNHACYRRIIGSPLPRKLMKRRSRKRGGLQRHGSAPKMRW